MVARKKASTKTATKARIPQLAWHEIKPAPIVLISGAEQFLADRAVSRLRDQLKAADPSLEVSDLTADSYQRGELLTLASPSLFGEPRLIRVSAVEKTNDDFLQEAIEYLAMPEETATVVLRHGGGVRGKKLLDAIRSGDSPAVEVVCAEISRDADKQDFVLSEFRAAGRKITPSGLRALLDAFSGDLAELSAASRQLIADLPGDITDESVNRYYAGRAEVTAFAVVDAAIAGRYADSLIALRHALATGADPVPVVAAFAAKLRAMAKVAGARGPAAQLSGKLGLAPWQVDRARRDLAAWDDRGVGRAIQAIAEADASVKGGGRDPVFALERLVEVMAARGRS